jgi:hypothetical protein
VSVSNEGVFGDTSDGLLGRLDSAAPEGTRVVIIECCGNDNKMGRTVANTPGNVTEMVRRVRTRGAEVVFLGPPELGEVASRFGARYCGKLNAGVPHEHMIGRTGAMHADAAGNSVIAAHVFPCVGQLFGSPERCRRKGSKKTNGPPGIRDRAMVLFKFCAVCDTPFISTRCDAKFCSSACRQACYRARKATKATEARRAADFAAALIR